MKIKKSTVITISILLAIILVVASLVVLLKYQKSHEVLEDTVTLFTNQPGELPYTDLLGNELALDQYLGKVLVVVSWASWSPFSQTDLMTMLELSNEYSSEEVAFLAINRKETKEQAVRFTNTLPKLDGVVVALDPRDIFYTTVGGYAMPETAIYNQQGEITQHYRGVTPKSDIKTVIDSLIIKE